MPECRPLAVSKFWRNEARASRSSKKIQDGGLHIASSVCPLRWLEGGVPRFLERHGKAPAVQCGWTTPRQCSIDH